MSTTSSKEIITYLVGVDVLGFPIIHTHELIYLENENIQDFKRRREKTNTSSIQPINSQRKSLSIARGRLHRRGS